MIHVPTAVYIDTEFFKNNGLRFDTRAFMDLKKTFIKGGLRLLIPKIMEREMSRHFVREAEKVVNAIVKAHEVYPIRNLCLSKIPSKNELKTKCIEEMNCQWSSFKKHFVVESLPITGNCQRSFKSVPISVVKSVPLS
jgi:hypothetical protein